MGVMFYCARHPADHSSGGSCLGTRRCPIPNYAYTCANEECGVEFDEVRKYEDRETPATCPKCESPANYTIVAPMVLKASFPDGYRRQNDPTWQQAREWSKLRRTFAGAKEKDKNEIRDEMDKVNGKTPPKKRINKISDLL